MLHAVLTVFLYELFKPAGRVVSLGFASISLMAIVLQAVSALLQLPALIIVADAGGVAAFSAEESQSLARISLVLSAQTFSFFGSIAWLYSWTRGQAKDAPLLDEASAPVEGEVR